MASSSRAAKWLGDSWLSHTLIIPYLAVRSDSTHRAFFAFFFTLFLSFVMKAFTSSTLLLYNVMGKISHLNHSNCPNFRLYQQLRWIFDEIRFPQQTFVTATSIMLYLECLSGGEPCSMNHSSITMLNNHKSSPINPQLTGTQYSSIEWDLSCFP